jgi:tetratricopeptide (TPR) repeat protein
MATIDDVVTRWSETGASLEPVLVFEAAAGPRRRAFIAECVQKLAARPMRTFSVSGDFERAGPWAGVNELVSALFPQIQAQRPDLVERHTFELVYIIPQLRRVLTVRNPSLTDLAPPGERSRNYAADRAFRIVHGLIDLLDEWKSDACPEEKWVIACDAYDSCGPMSRSFFKELVRRRGSRLRLHLLIAVGTGNGAAALALFPEHSAHLVSADVDHEPEPVVDPTTASLLAMELEQKIGNDPLEKQVHLPNLLSLWRSAGRLDKVLECKYFGLEIYNPLGLYEDALCYAEGILPLAEKCEPENVFRRWSIIMKMLACYSSLQNAKAGLELGEREGLKIVERNPAWRAQVLYMLAMLYARYSQPRDFARGEQYLEEGIAAIEEAGLPEGEFHLHSVFNRNGLAMIRSFQGRPQDALDLCRIGVERLNKHLASDKHRLHRSVLIYNIAQVYSAIGDYDQALEHYAAVMKMDPNYSEYYNERGNLYLRLGRLEEARDDYLKAMELSPPYHEVFANLGQCHRRMGDMQKAIGCYSRALDLNPDLTLALLGRARAHEELENFQAAIDDYTAALALDPSQWDALASRGILYYQQQDRNLSLADFNRAIELQGKQLELYLNRATVLSDLGRRDEAICDLEMALSMDPGEEDRQEIESRLENMRAMVQ